MLYQSGWFYFASDYVSIQAQTNRGVWFLDTCGKILTCRRRLRWLVFGIIMETTELTILWLGNVFQPSAHFLGISQENISCGFDLFCVVNFLIQKPAHKSEWPIYFRHNAPWQAQLYNTVPLPVTASTRFPATAGRLITNKNTSFSPLKLFQNSYKNLPMQNNWINRLKVFN